jgi:phage FluMu gp28-like protein
MSAILPSVKIDSDAMLARCFMPHQIHWIQAEEEIHALGKQAFALAEKSIRIGWTYADAFKNVRKRLRFKKRDYLFATKDYPSALEYMSLCKEFAELHNFARSIVAHGEQVVKAEPERAGGFTEEIKMGYIKFDNGSRIIAFSASPQAMSVYGGDVGLDEFAKHPNAQLLWETAQGRVTWGYDMAVWSAHDGEGTLFNQLAQEARAACGHSGTGVPAELVGQASRLPAAGVSLGSNPITVAGETPELAGGTPALLSDASVALRTPQSALRIPKSPWNLYYRVTLVDAIELGLLDVINRVQGTRFTAEQFIADCQSRSRQEEVFQQSYMCNPQGAASGNIVDWSAIERCRYDYPIERVHLEAGDVTRQFGAFNPCGYDMRATLIHQFLRKHFARLFEAGGRYRIGFDVAASGQGDLAVFYIDEAKGSDLWLRALLTVRTEDWDFLKTVLFFFLKNLPSVQAAGDATGLGQQICWEAAQHYSWRFESVNFSSKKSDLGFALMNQLAVAEKRIPRSEQDIASDYFALRKTHNGTKWVFSEGRNLHNPASHCDIAWAGALATHAHTERRHEAGGMVA